MHAEFTWFKGIVLAISIVVLVIGIINIIYFDKIRLNDGCGEITGSDATIALWLNIIMVVLSAIILLWSFFRLIDFETKNESNVSVNEIQHTHTVDSNVEYVPS